MVECLLCYSVMGAGTKDKTFGRGANIVVIHRE